MYEPLEEASTVLLCTSVGFVSVLSVHVAPASLYVSPKDIVIGLEPVITIVGGVLSCTG